MKTTAVTKETPLNGKDAPENGAKNNKTAASQATAGATKSEEKQKQREQQAKEEQAKANTSEQQAKAAQALNDVKLPVMRPNISAQDRISKLEVFTKLSERRNFLKEKHTEVEKFKASQDGLNAKISIECAGASIIISNNTIIQKVVQLCEMTLNEMLGLCDEEIINFEI